jgi:hypothetical protein
MTINNFGLWKDYLYRPSHDPDAQISPEDLYRPHLSTIIPELDRPGADKPSNRTVDLLLNWQNTGSPSKSNEEIDNLVHNVLLHPDFDLNELISFNTIRENKKSDAKEEQSPLLSFQHADIKIEVPSGTKLTASQLFSIPGLYYRNIMSLIKDTFESVIFLQFHLTPYKLFCRHPYHDQHIYSEIYDSGVFLEEHDKVQCAPVEGSCDCERVVAALMFWSDATHLVTFGTTNLWPIYMQFGNLSKYIRGKLNSGATKHVAYIPPLPDSLRDELKAFHEKWNSQKKDILTHCRWELMHGVWRFLLDREFLSAYKHGMVVQCYDGIERRIYPRIFTYSADYPEK